MQSNWQGIGTPLQIPTLLIGFDTSPGASGPGQNNSYVLSHTNPGRVSRFGQVVSDRVVSDKFWGESIRPILVGGFSRELFRPWVVSAHVCVCVLGPRLLFTQLKYQEYQAFPNDN